MLGRNTYALIVITLYAIVGLCVYSDYGISWDEEFQHDYGKVVYAYVFNGDEALLEHRSRYHGPIVQFGLYTLEKTFGLEDSKDVFEMRHLITFLISVVGCWFFYRLLLLFRFSHYWSTVGLLFLICSPRILAHSFYNSKDAVFMYGFIIAIYTMMKFLRNPSWKTAIWHGLVCGVLIDIRILGLFVPLTTGLLWTINLIRDTGRISTSIQSMGVLIAITSVSMFAFWPTLWHSPIAEFQNALTKMSAYPWDDPILFEGAFQLPLELPWYYLPKWMLISTPLFISAFALIGLVFWFLNYRIRITEKFIPFLWVLLPFGLILWKNATVYDGWRHVFFIYPAVLILAVHGSRSLFEGWEFSKYLRLVPMVFLISPIQFIANAHPFQQVYFNPMFTQDAWKNYEMDYWGLSYKQGLVELAKMQPEGDILLTVPNAPGFYNHWILPENDRKRMRYVPYDSAHFFVSNFRFPTEHESFAKGSGAYARPLEIIEVSGNPVVGIFDLRKD